MAIRGKKRAQTERSRKHRSQSLRGRSGSTALDERDKRLWRNGLLKGASLAEENFLRALEEVGLKVTQFGDRLKFRGVECDPPADFSDEHPMAKLRRRSE